MQIFLSYASEDRELADQVYLALSGAGHQVFFDKDSLPPGGDYHTRIRNAVERSDIFVFLISPNSIASGSYALTELKYARAKWPHPKGRLLPVRVKELAWDQIPGFLKAVTVLEPEGNIPAETLDAVSKMMEEVSENVASTDTIKSNNGEGATYPEIEKTHKITVPILVAVIGMVGLLGAAAIANWDKLFPFGRDVSTEIATVARKNIEKEKRKETVARKDIQKEERKETDDLEQISSVSAPARILNTSGSPALEHNPPPFIGYNYSDFFDVVFVLDQTLSNAVFAKAVYGAMGFLARDYNINAEVRLKIGIVTFYDRSAETGFDLIPVNRQIVLSDLSELTKLLRLKIIEIEYVSGGGDLSEAVFDGVYEALINTKWSKNSNRAIILIGDASGHTDDSQLNPAGHTVESLLQLAAEMSVRINTIYVGDDAKTIDQFASLSRGVNPVLRGEAHVGYLKMDAVIVRIVNSWIDKTLSQPQSLIMPVNKSLDRGDQSD